MQTIQDYLKLIQTLSTFIPPSTQTSKIDLNEYVVICCIMCMLSYTCKSKEDLIEMCIQYNVPLIQMNWIHTSTIDFSNNSFIRIDCPNIIYIVFRGSSTIIDHIKNVCIGTTSIHTAWMIEAMQLCKEKRIQDCFLQGKPIIVTGHSKGGLLATYMCILFSLTEEKKMHDVYAILFGTPEYFPKEYTEYFKYRVIHVSNYADILSCLSGGSKCGTFTTKYIKGTPILRWKKAHSITEYYHHLLYHTKE